MGLDAVAAKLRGKADRRPQPRPLLAGWGGEKAPGRAVALVALTILALELLPWAYRFNPRCAAGRLYPETRITRMLYELSGGHGRYMAASPRAGWRLDKVPTETVLPPNAGTVYGVRSVDGYDSLYPTTCRTVVGQIEGADPSPLANGNMFLLENTRAWRGKADLVVAAEGQEAGWGRPMFQAEGCNLFADPAGGTRRLQLTFGGKARPDAGAGFTRDGCNALDLQVQTPDEGVLYVADTWYPGWLAFVDGEYRGGLLAAGSGRTLPLQPGDRNVSMVYYPPRVAVGEFVSLCALAMIVALAVAFGKAGRGQ